MPTPAPDYVFKFLAVSRPDDTYYETRWDRAKPVEVIAADRKAAISLADSLMGDPGDRRHWVFRFVSARDVRILEEESNGQDDRTPHVRR